MTLREQLKDIVDQHGLYDVLGELSAYCVENADTIGISDIALADAWRANAWVILRAMNKLWPIAK